MSILKKSIFLFCGLHLCSILLGQGKINSNKPIKFRLLMTSINLEDISSDEIVVTLNAFNTGRNPVDLSKFDAVPEEMEVKFEEAFYRSSINSLEGEIISSLLNRNITITNGKILRNLRFNLPINEALYKELIKEEKSYNRSYSSRSKTKAPKVKYKTNTKTSAKRLKDVFAKDETKAKSTKARANADVEDKIVDSEPVLKDKKRTTVNEENPSAKVEEQKTKVVKAKKESKPRIAAKKKVEKLETEKAKAESYKIEQASQKEDEKAILESLGVKDESDKKKSGEVAFDTKEGVEASKNSYAEKAVCPDLILENLQIVKKNDKWVTLEYTLTNVGKGPAYLANESIAMRAFLSSSENLSKGSIPLGGGFVDYDKKDKDGLGIKESYSATIKLDIKKMTRFTPFVILNLDPFNVVDECSKANNYGNIKVRN